MNSAIRTSIIALLAVSLLSSCNRKKREENAEPQPGKQTQTETQTPVAPTPSPENSNDTSAGEGFTGDLNSGTLNTMSDAEEIESYLSLSDYYQKSNAPNTRASIEAEVRKSSVERVRKAAAAAQKVQSVSSTYRINMGSQIYTTVRILMNEKIETIQFLSSTTSDYAIGKTLTALTQSISSDSLKNVGSATITCLTKDCFQYRLRFLMPTEIRGEAIPVNVLYSYSAAQRSVYAQNGFESSRLANTLFDYFIGKTVYEQDTYMALEKSEVIMGASHMQVIYLGGNNEGVSFNLPLKRDQKVTANLEISVLAFQNLPLNGSYVNQSYQSKIASITMNPISSDSRKYEMMVMTKDPASKKGAEIKFVVESI